jgi:hypothetical protein
MFIAIRSALWIMSAGCEAGITSFAVSENSVSHLAKYLSSMGVTLHSISRNYACLL